MRRKRRTSKGGGELKTGGWSDSAGGGGKGRRVETKSAGLLKHPIVSHCRLMPELVEAHLCPSCATKSTKMGQVADNTSGAEPDERRSVWFRL